MCPKFVDQHQNRPSPGVWRDLLLCHLSKAFLAKCAPWWNDLSEKKKLYTTRSQNDASNNQILETSTQPQMTGLLSIFVQIQSLRLLLFLRFTKIKPLKIHGKGLSSKGWYYLLKMELSILRSNQQTLIRQ